MKEINGIFLIVIDLSRYDVYIMVDIWVSGYLDKVCICKVSLYFYGCIYL